MTTLDTFLRSDELDDTIRLVGEIDMDAANTEAIRGIVRDWTDEQAVANLLMYPHLLPEDIRLDALLQGLNQPLDSYAVLAAIVGLQSMNGLPDADRMAIVRRLIEIVQNSPLKAPPTTAARATVLLNGIVRPDDAGAVSALLGHPDETIRHNTLTALIDAVGLQNVGAVIAAANNPAAKAYVDEKLAGSEGFFKNGELDYGQWYLSDLSAPLLAYIPNLKDFSA